jgi:hypothetical protein
MLSAVCAYYTIRLTVLAIFSYLFSRLTRSLLLVPCVNAAMNFEVTIEILFRLPHVGHILQYEHGLTPFWMDSKTAERKAQAPKYGDTAHRIIVAVLELSLFQLHLLDITVNLYDVSSHLVSILIKIVITRTSYSTQMKTCGM